MVSFEYRQNILFAERVSLAEIAKQFGTPCYVYSKAVLENNWRSFTEAFKDQSHLLCYSVKANSNIALLNVLHKLGSGFDIVSQGELERVLKAGGEPAKIVFSGVGKRVSEIERALAVGIYCFNVESTSELARIEAIAKEQSCVAPVAIRVNPHIDPKTHPYIATGLKESKFGVEWEEALTLFQYANQSAHLQVKGIDCHIGSQITTFAPFLEMLAKIEELAEQLQRLSITIEHVNIGGGLGVTYQQEKVISPQEYVEAIRGKTKGKFSRVIIEPGRAVVATAGVLLTTVEYLKPTAHHTFAIVDAAMNDFLRPALYEAWHDIVEVVQGSGQDKALYDVVGPICESSDCFGKQRALAVREGDLLAILSVGAYGFTMSSNYNTRGRAAEVLVDGDKVYEIRARENATELFEKEKLLC